MIAPTPSQVADAFQHTKPLFAESLRLADMEGLYHADAALRMGISRQTFGNIVARARKKVATAILQGQALKIGEDATSNQRVLRLRQEPHPDTRKP